MRRPSDPAFCAGLIVLLTAFVAPACGSSTDGGATPTGDGGGNPPVDSGTDAGGGGDAPAPTDAATPVDAALPLGAPISAPAGQWTWVPFPDSACSDGSPTGIGIYPTTASNKVLVFFDGGGACWDYETCFQLQTATLGPFGAAQFAGVPPVLGSTVLDPTATQNPFKDYNLVFVPYCTGDLFTGDNVVVYAGANDAGSQPLHHVGRLNVEAYLARLGATFASPGEVAFAGSSAGGGGALFNYPLARAYWPNATMILLDDSLPLLEGSAVPDAFKSAWFQNWGAGAVTDPICGAACRTDLSIFMKDVAALFPNDRMELLSSEQDQTIRSYLLLSPTQFQTDLNALATDVLDPTSNFRHFFVAGQTHTMLGDPGSFSTAAGMQLWTWLGQMATGDSAWASTGP